MSITQFTVEYNLFTNAANGTETPLTGSVIFTPVTVDDKPIQVPDFDPPTGFKLSQFVGYIDADGELKDAPEGDPGVQLWANDPLLGLEGDLFYRVEFRVKTLLGEPVKVEGGFLAAPSTATTVNLSNALESTGSSIVGATREAGYAEDILDASSLGRSLIKAVDAPAARTLLGIDLTDLDEWEWYDNLAAFPVTGSSGVVYGARDTGLFYRWSGTAYVKVSSDVPIFFDARDYGVVGEKLWTATSATTTITSTGHGLSNGDRVFFMDLGTATNIGFRTNYYVVNKTDNTFQVATTAGGSALSLGTATVKYCKYVQRNNVANLMDVVAQCAAAGGGTVVLPAGVIDTSEAVMRTTVTADSGRTYLNRGAIQLPWNTPIRILGQGKNVTTLRLSPGFQRAFDLPWKDFVTTPTFRDIELGDMQIDGQQISGTVIAPNTTVVTPPGAPTTITIPGSQRYVPGVATVEASVSDYQNILFYANTSAFPGAGAVSSFATTFAGTGETDKVYVSSATGWSYVFSGGSYTLATYVWVTIPGIDGQVFKNADAVFGPGTNAGTFKDAIYAGRVNPNNPSEFQMAHSVGTNLRTLVNGDTVQGTLQGAILVGNSHLTDASRFNGGITYFIDVKNLWVHDIDVTNVFTRPEYTGFLVNWSNHTFIVGINGSYNSQAAYFPAITGDLYSSIVNVRVDRCKGYGSDYGFFAGSSPQTVTNAKRTWCDEIWFLDSFHDTMKDWTTSGLAGGTQNFMIGAAGPLGRCGIIRCEGRRSGDTGIEIDNPYECYDIDNRIVDALNPILVRAQGIPARTSAGPVTTTLSGAIDTASVNASTSAVFAMDFRTTKYPTLFNTPFVEEQGYVMIDSELCWYQVTSVATNGTSTSVTLWRGQNGTTPASHANGAKVWFVEHDKARVISSGHRVEFTGSWASHPPLQLNDFGEKFPAPRWLIRNGIYNYHSGFGQLLAVNGHTPEVDMQNCTLIAGRVSIDTDAGPNFINVSQQAAVTAFARTVDAKDAGVPIPPSRIYGRNNKILVSGNFKDAPNRYYTSFGPVAGYYAIDWEADTAIDIARTGATISSTTSAVRLNPTGTDSTLTGTKKLILAPGSRVKVSARIPTGGDNDPAPLSAFIGASSVVTGAVSVEVNDVSGTLTASVDATAPDTILVGTPQTHSAPAKSVPVGADEIALLDSADRFSLRKLTWADLLAEVQSDIPISGIAATGTPDSTVFLRGDGAWEVGVAGPTGPQGPAGTSGIVDGGNAASPGPIVLDGGDATSNAD